MNRVGEGRDIQLRKRDKDCYNNLREKHPFLRGQTDLDSSLPQPFIELIPKGREGSYPCLTHNVQEGEEELKGII